MQAPFDIPVGGDHGMRGGQQPSYHPEVDSVGSSGACSSLHPGTYVPLCSPPHSFDSYFPDFSLEALQALYGPESIDLNLLLKIWSYESSEEPLSLQPGCIDPRMLHVDVEPEGAGEFQTQEMAPSSMPSSPIEGSLPDDDLSTVMPCDAEPRDDEAPVAASGSENMWGDDAFVAQDVKTETIGRTARHSELHCSCCGEGFAHVASRRRHEERRNKDKAGSRPACPACAKVFSRRDALLRHVDNQHPGEDLSLRKRIRRRKVD